MANASVNSWLIENRLLVGASETTFGVPVTSFSNSDSNVRARELNLSSLTVEYDDESSKFATGDHTRDEAIAGITQGTIDFNLKLAQGQIYVSASDYPTPGTFNVADPTATPNTATGNLGLTYKKYLEGCGLVSVYNHAKVTSTGSTVTVTSAGNWEFYPSTEADLKTLSLAIQDKASLKVGTPATQYGIHYKIAGAMSTLSISVDGAGKPFMVNLSYTGKVSDVYEVSDTAGTLLEYDDQYSLSTIANKMLYTYVTIEELLPDGTPTGEKQNWCVNTFNLDAGTTITTFQCQEDGSGIKYNAITSRDPRITINPLLERVGPTSATSVVNEDWFDFWEAVNSESSYKLSITTYDKDKTAPNAQEQFAIIVPRAQVISPNISDSDGYLRDELTFRPLRNKKATGVGADQKEADYVIRIYADTKVL